MANTPFFSIGITVYNTEKYLTRCLESVLGQSFSDFEIVIVNDGSSDGSMQLMQNFAQNDSRIKIVDKTNGGVSTAKNAILSSTPGTI